MKHKAVFLLVLFLVGFLLTPVLSAEGDWAPISIKDASGQVYVEIRPEIELLAGVLSQTSWMEQAGPAGSGNRYFRELKAFFEPYKEHKAIILAEKLTKRGFTYDAPPNFILSLGPLPDLSAVNGYSQYLRKRAGGKRQLENFRRELAKLAAESEFLQFYQEQRPYLEELLISSTAGFDGQKILAWLQDFFGAEGDEYHLVLAPAFFPGGGYGATIETKEGKVLVYQIIREYGQSEDTPEFGDMYNLEQLSLHEWGHSFVNPALEKDSRQVRTLDKLFIPVKERMAQMAYPHVEIFFNEQVLRAAVLLGTKDLYGELEYARGLEIETMTGFYLTEFTVEQLEYYRENRDKYPDFVQFVPYLLEQYQQHQAELLSLLQEAKESNIREVKIKAAYWAGESGIATLTPRYYPSLLIEAELPIRPHSPEQVNAFLLAAGLDFQLVAPDQPVVEARIYEGNLFPINNRITWGFWLALTDDEYKKVVPGVSYRLVPKTENPEYRWVMSQDITLVQAE
jgi:hypothetical protein